MQFNMIDFFVGLFLMNAMPHMLFGLFEIRFLSAFGFSSKANLAYAFLNVALALVLFHIQYGIAALLTNGMLIGAGTVLVIYLVSGKFLLRYFQKT